MKLRPLRYPLETAKMARPEDPVKDDVDMKEPLNTSGKLEMKYSPLEQETHLTRRELDADNQNLENGLHERGMGCIKDGCCLHGEAMPRKIPYSTITAIILAIALMISVSFNIKQNGFRCRCNETQVPGASREEALLHKVQRDHSPKSEQRTVQTELQTTPASLCPSNWTMGGETCYYFSDTQGTWNFSQSYCSSYGGSLLTNRSNQEWDFITMHRRRAECWINLKRENLTEPWKWPNGSLVDSRIYIGGEGCCAYLNEKAASSTSCDNVRHWICSKPISPT